MLVEGQMSAEQYSQVITTLNGLIKKGEVSVSDIDKNKGKLDQTYLSDELLQQMAGNTPINAVPADGSITAIKLADKSVGNRTLMTGGVFSDNIAKWAVNESHLAGDSVGNSKLKSDSVSEIKIKDGAVTVSKVDFDELKLSSGKLYPLINFKLDGVEQPYTQKVKDSILDAKIYGAEYGKVYQLDSVRNNLSGNYGLRVSSFDAPIQGDLDSSTRKTVLNSLNENVQVVTDYESDPEIVTITTKNVDGVSASVTIDSVKTGFITNLSENKQGYAFGTIIHPSKYIYSDNASGGSSNPQELSSDVVCVDKTTEDINIYIPNGSGSYIRYHLYRYTKPFELGIRWSNSDIWAINRISRATKLGDEFTEDPNNVFVYSTTNTTTMDTIFRLVGETDYSGGYYHGDEILENFSIIVGNKDVTNLEGRFYGNSVEILQHTKLFEDTYTAEVLTDEYLLVKKMHRFSRNDGYTLKSRFEFLKSVDVEFSCPGALSIPRLDPSGNVNFKTALDLSNMVVHDISVPGALPHSEDTNEWKFIGEGKDVTITVDSDSEYLGTWLRNSESDTKMYSRIIRQNSTVDAGTVLNATVNYKFNTNKLGD